MVDIYGENWDKYYKSVEGKLDEVPWEVDAAFAAKREFKLFEGKLPNDLPIADLGCGTGSQTLFLAQHFPKAIGLDVSAEVIKTAKTLHSSPKIDYHTFDVLNLAAAEDLQRQYGDMNIYMRGTLQQILPEHRPSFAPGIKALLGTKGKMFMIELSPMARLFFAKLFKQLGGVPKSVENIFKTKVTSLVGVSQEDVKAVFEPSGLQILEMGDSIIDFKVAGQENAAVPAVYAIIGPAV